MLNLKDIFSIVQNELINVSDTFTAISDCIFPDNAELTINIVENNIRLTYSEIKNPDDFNSDLIVTFKNLFMSDFQNKDSLKLKIKEEIIRLSLLNNKIKLNNDFKNLSSKLSKTTKESLLANEQAMLKLRHNEFYNLKGIQGD